MYIVYITYGDFNIKRFKSKGKLYVTFGWRKNNIRYNGILEERKPFNYFNLFWLFT